MLGEAEEEEVENSCPVCGTIFMTSASHSMKERHINACLDGGVTASAGLQAEANGTIESADMDMVVRSTVESNSSSLTSVVPTPRRSPTPTPHSNGGKFTDPSSGVIAPSGCAPQQAQGQHIATAPDIDELFGTFSLGNPSVGGSNLPLTAGQSQLSQRASGAPSRGLPLASTYCGAPPASGQSSPTRPDSSMAAQHSLRAAGMASSPTPTAVRLPVVPLSLDSSSSSNPSSSSPLTEAKPQQGGKEAASSGKDDEAISLIAALCPGIPTELAAGMLDACAGDVEQTVRLLEDMQRQQEAEERADARRHRKQHEEEAPQQGDGEGYTGGGNQQRAAAGAAKKKRKKVPLWEGPVEVELIVYDLKPEMVSRHFGFGVYHSAVIIAGKEFAFGGSPDAEDADKPGVFICRPECAAPTIKKRFSVGHTCWSPDELFESMEKWGATDWKIGHYHLLSKNCNHFSVFFLKFLHEKCVIRGRAELEQEFKDALAEIADKEESGGGLRDGGFPRITDQATLRAYLHEGENKALKEEETNTSISSSLFAGIITGWTGGAAGEDTTTSGGSQHLSYQYRNRAERKLSEKYAKRLKDCDKDELCHWQLPDWVNRAARLGDTLVPAFMYNKVVEKETAGGATPNEGSTTDKATPPSGRGGGALVSAPPALPGEGQASESGAYDGRRQKQRQAEPTNNDDDSRTTRGGYDGPPPPSAAAAAVPTTPLVAIASIKGILPHVDDDVIANALQQTGGNIEQAIDHLLSSS